MGIRETISYNKNFVTDQEIFTKKDKSTEAPMINIATIQLFNAKTGKLEYEAKAENIVNNLISKYAYMDYYYYKIKGYITSQPYNATPFQVMVLTDYAGAEDADIQLAKGTLIGYADKATAYVGTDPLKGTINLAETVLDINNNGLLHFVFDFPTNAANGTFRTIWWSYGPSNPLVNLASYYAVFNWSIFTYYKDGIICSTNGMGSSFIAFTDNCVPKANVPVSGVSLTGAAGVGADCNGTNIFILDTSWVPGIYKLSFDMSTVISKTSLATAYVSTVTGGIADITELNGIIYALTEKFYIVPLNATTGVWGTPIDIKSKFGYASTYSNYYGGITHNGIDRWYISSGLYPYIYTLDMDYNVIETRFFNLVGNPCKLSYDRVKGYLYYVTYSTGSYYMCKTRLEMTAPGAQNLLAAPITKTAAQTMKIQYDFNIQKVL